MAPPFRFRQFVVNDDRSTMKTGTDAMLLGALAQSEKASSILDIGTGCGIIALMLIQRNPGATADAVESDPESAVQAAGNFKGSPWANNLNAIHATIQDYSKNCRRRYDLIVCNPPFFNSSLLGSSHKKNQARHMLQLHFNDLIKVYSQLLSNKGSAWTIIPYNCTNEFLDEAKKRQLFPSVMINIAGKENKKCIRTVVELKKNQSETETLNFNIRNKDGHYSQEYLNLTRAYHEW